MSYFYTMEQNEETERIFFRIINIFKRIIELHVINKHSTDAKFNFTHVPYIMNIGSDGISNTELVSQIKVTRQAVSKTVREMENVGLIYILKSENDARTIMIHLTEKGKALFDAIKVDANELCEQYINVLGSDRYEKLIDSLLELVAFHEMLEKK